MKYALIAAVAWASLATAVSSKWESFAENKTHIEVQIIETGKLRCRITEDSKTATHILIGFRIENCPVVLRTGEDDDKWKTLITNSTFVVTAGYAIEHGTERTK